MITPEEVKIIINVLKEYYNYLSEKRKESYTRINIVQNIFDFQFKYIRNVDLLVSIRKKIKAYKKVCGDEKKEMVEKALTCIERAIEYKMNKGEYKTDEQICKG